MITDQRSFDLAREKDLDRSVQEHFSENVECEDCGKSIDVDHGEEVMQGNDNEDLCEDCFESQGEENGE